MTDSGNSRAVPQSCCRAKPVPCKLLSLSAVNFFTVRYEHQVLENAKKGGPVLVACPEGNKTIGGAIAGTFGESKSLLLI